MQTRTVGRDYAYVRSVPSFAGVVGRLRCSIEERTDGTVGKYQSVELSTLSIVAVGTRCGSGKLFWSDSSARDCSRVSYKSEKLTSCRCLVCIAGW